jgi:hypothetical protein
MLSAAGEGSSGTLVDSAYTALEDRLPEWPTTQAEEKWYPPIAMFLNGCVDACHAALDGPPTPTARDLRWYDRLNFIVYDTTTEDGIDGASPLKPDLVGGFDLGPNDRVAWNPQSTLTKEVLLPVEVKSDWAPMINQAATYARCLFSANPSRQFAMVLIIRHAKAELRFLVFHRSGLTASNPFSVKNSQGQKDILRVFLSILGWTSANDAGFLEFCNDFGMCLPRYKGDNTGVVTGLTEVLHDGLCVQGRASRVLLMEYPTGKGKELESRIPALDPTVPTHEHAEAGAQGGGDTRASFHRRYIQVAL